MFCIVPITNLALAQLGPADLKAGSGLVNVMRNLGGAIGLALINTQLFYERFERHVAAFAAQMRPAREVVDARLQAAQAALDSHFVDEARAALAARALLARLGAHEALALSFGDVFLLLSLSFIAAFVLIAAVRSSAAGSPQAND